MLCPFALEHDCTGKLDCSSLHSYHSALLLWGLKLAVNLFEPCRGKELHNIMQALFTKHNGQSICPSRLPLATVFSHCKDRPGCCRGVCVGQRRVWQAGFGGQRGVQPTEAMQGESHGGAQSDPGLLRGNPHHGAHSRGTNLWLGPRQLWPAWDWP